MFSPTRHGPHPMPPTPKGRGRMAKTATRNKRLGEQLRKELAKHYRNKYRVR